MIKAVFDNLINEKKNNFTIGINDDVTNLSLPTEKDFKIKNAKEFLIYGYGSDGMVTASKNIIKLIGENKEDYVQGYFQYDSKKSGGVTSSHLRFSDNPIRSTYYVENPSLVVCTKESYLKDFDIINNIEQGGIFLLNTSKKEEEIIEFLSDKVKYILKEKNIQFYTINAYELARKVGLKNKISTIMETVIVYLSNLMDIEESKELLKKYAENKFSKKGEDIVNSNIEAIDLSISYLKKINIPDISYQKEDTKVPNSVVEAMNMRFGNELSVKSFTNRPDGSFETETSKYEKRCISDIVPKWINENCIMCNQCSLICPHAVIRPFLLNEEEYQESPSYIKERCLKPIEKNLQEYYYMIGISIKDCTGCGLCMKICPGKKEQKALIPIKLEESLKNKEQDIFDYLVNNVKEKELISKYTVKGSQFKTPKLEFHGACAGCGEPAYIKILTQLYGEELIISNATGCSSIYGASAPSMPYKLPWSNSLFEDNAEYGYGILIANNVMKKRIQKYMEKNK